MDKVLLLDFLNLVHRANITFGKKFEQHEPIQPDAWLEYKPQIGDPQQVGTHCVCGAKWDIDEAFCYGERYNIVYVFFRNLKALVEQFQPDAIFCCLEGAHNFRYDLFPDYKANRIIKNASKQEEKDRFNKQRDIILPLLSHLPITIATADKYEADDVIASLADDLKEEEVIIISGDTDFIQLLQKGYKHLSIYSPVKKAFLEAPDYFYLPFKCLKGDPSDNISGIPSIGIKKAEKLVRDPEVLKVFLQAEEHRAVFNLNRELIELKVIPLEELTFVDFQLNLEFLKEAFNRMKLEGITSEPYWGKFQTTFNSVQC
jgi:5'-3' exonuclease